MDVVVVMAVVDVVGVMDVAMEEVEVNAKQNCCRKEMFLFHS